MKKAKKLLALAMAVAMLAGLLAFAGPAVGAAAGPWPREGIDPWKYNDHDDIDTAYEQAVQVLTKMGVIEGNGNTLLPGDELTRAEAATIIARAGLARGGGLDRRQREHVQRR